MKTFLFSFVLFVVSFNVFPDDIIATLDITNVITFPGQAFDPLVIRNTDQKEWLVVWTEASTRKFTTYGRLVSDNGDLAAAEKLKRYAPNVLFSLPLDGVYDPDHGIYMVLLPTSKGILAQPYQPSLARKGKPKNLTNLFKPLEFFFPQIVYDPDTKTLNVYGGTTESGCFGCPQNVQTFKVDETGKAISTPNQLVTGVVQPILELDAFRNPVTKNTLLLLRGSDSPDNLLGYVVKPDGTLLKQTALKIATNKTFGAIRGSAAFDLAGTGMISWTLLSTADRSQQTKFRPIKVTETRLGKTKKLPKGGFPPDGSFYQATAIVFDDSNNEYVILWHDLGSLKGVRIDAATGNLVGSTFTLASVNVSPDGGITDISSSYDVASGRVVVVWSENSTFSATFQVRAVIFEK